MAQLLRGRHAWLAASVPPDEEAAVLAAHHAALAQSHRALLFLAPRGPDRIDPLAEAIEASGLVVARRSWDEDPTDEVQVMLTDGPTEMGLWYRLAPVTYLGGTLSGDDTAARHPFEPAALGSAIVHGPHTDRHATEWQQLGGAGAARQVADAEGLATAIAELSQPDLIATLASNAWTVSTGGADVTMRICAPVLDAIGKART
jgi:3-deoxy-D-manno-octulosonic-acid transferase